MTTDREDFGGSCTSAAHEKCWILALALKDAFGELQDEIEGGAAAANDGIIDLAQAMGYQIDVAASFLWSEINTLRNESVSLMRRLASLLGSAPGSDLADELTNHRVCRKAARV